MRWRFEKATYKPVEMANPFLLTDQVAAKLDNKSLTSPNPPTLATASG